MSRHPYNYASSYDSPSAGSSSSTSLNRVGGGDHSYYSERPFGGRKPSTESSRYQLPPTPTHQTMMTTTTTTTTTEEEDDFLHTIDSNWDKSRFGWNLRGFLNILTLLFLALALLMLFLGYPILIEVKHLLGQHAKSSGGSGGFFGLGGTNGSGQVPELDIATLIDADTPSQAQTWVSGHDKSSYHLVFSDEFEIEGRTFWPGEDPFWEAVDLWYSGTGDFEWYSPEAVNTSNGAMVIALEEYQSHNMNFRSGMVQSWNKFCFQGGYVEVAAKLPGGPATSGYWAAAWLMGNLGRPGYLGTTDGTWPYSYTGCDTGILPNQTFVNGTGPYLAKHSTAAYSDNGALSHLPGMRYSSCTCPGEDHPGPDVTVGRSAPEIDIYEVQVQTKDGTTKSYASQSLQVGPFDDAYGWTNTSAAAKIYDDSITSFNTYTGGVIQEAVSSVTRVPDRGFNNTDNEYIKYGVEYVPDWNADGSGSVTWYLDGKPTWSVNSKAFPPNQKLDIGQRVVPVEPMAIVLNLAVSSSFQHVDFGRGGITFPAYMAIDYVRVYQKDGQTDRITCDPKDHPTADFIAKHPELYYNQNLTQFPKDLYSWPKNRLQGCD